MAGLVTCKRCDKNHELYVPEFRLKTNQLYEMTVVRHGMMLVGPTGSGKTRILRSLQAGQTACKGLADSNDPYEKTRVYIMNAKSIMPGQLYGSFDPMTR